MDDVMDRMERVESRFLAFRLPREGKEKGEEGADGDGENGNVSVNVGFKKEKNVVGEAPVLTGEMEEEEVLKNTYEMPNSLVPLSV